MWILDGARLALCVIWLASLALPGGVSPQKPQKEPFRIYAPFWSESGGLTSALILHNSNVRASAVVTPVLYTTHGRELRLSTKTLPPNAVLRLSLDEALREVRTWAPAGALAIEIEGNPAGVSGKVVMQDLPRSLTFGFRMGAGYGKRAGKTLQTVWWLRTPEDQAAVTLFNASAERIVVQPSVVFDRTERPLPEVQLDPYEVREFSLRVLLRPAGIRGVRVGILRFHYEGPKHALVPSLFTYNRETGFSMTGEFEAKGYGGAEDSTTLYAPGVMINQPPKEMGFPYSVYLAPHVLLANTTEKMLPVTLEASFQRGPRGPVEKRSLGVVRLAGLEARIVDYLQFVSGGLIPSDVWNINLKISYPGAKSSLSYRIASMDSSSNYVIAADIVTPMSGFEAMYWRVDGTEDSVFTIQNTSEREVSVRVDLSFGRGVGTYRLPLLRLRSDESRTLTLKAILDSGVPDDEGRMIPQGVVEGSARIIVAGNGDRVVATLAVYDAFMGMCEAFPAVGNCLDPATSQILADGHGTVGDAGLANFYASNNQGQTDLTPNATFVSSDPAVVTVVSIPGSPNNGRMDFVGAGTVQITASAPAELWDAEGGMCAACVEGVIYSEQSQLWPPTAQVASDPRIDSITPARGLVGGTTSVTISGGGFNGLLSIVAESGVSGTISSSSLTSISAQFTVSGTTGGGNKTVRVRANNRESNSRDFFVQIPSSLSVISVSVLPTGTSGDFGCKPGFDYGIAVDIRYQVLDQQNPKQPIANATMIPFENVMFSDGNTDEGNIGPSRISTTSLTTRTDGTFHDAPVLLCNPLPFFSPLTQHQLITIKVGTASYPVRSNTFTYAPTTLAGRGAVTNGSDISAQR